nr:hypothetical protein [Natronomonas sp. LN261]
MALVSPRVSNRRRLERLLRTKLNAVGRRYEETKRAYTDAKTARLSNLPTDEEGRARIVCRRHAEKRAVPVDEDGRPACYDPDHPDCRGCVDDVRADRIETW